MSQLRIILISPDASVVALLGDSLRASGFAHPPETVSHYPDEHELYALGSASNPPAAFLVDLADEKVAFEVLRDVRKLHPGVITIVANGSRRLSTLVRAKQAGAWGYLTSPYDLTPLAEQLGVTAPLRPAKTLGGRVVSFIPAQGGNGASTVCLHVATAIASQLGGQTLLADLDLHTGTVAFQLGIEQRQTLAAALEAERLDR